MKRGRVRQLSYRDTNSSARPTWTQVILSPFADVRGQRVEPTPQPWRCPGGLASYHAGSGALLLAPSGKPTLTNKAPRTSGETNDPPRGCPSRLLYEMVPRAAGIALLVNPQAPGAESQFEDAQTAAQILSQEIVVVKASSETDLDAAFAILSHVGAEALLVAADPFFNSQREQLIALAARYIIPAIYEFREFPLAGGLMSYGTNLASAYHQVGVYTGKILKGEIPPNLPVVQPTMSNQACTCLPVVGHR